MFAKFKKAVKALKGKITELYLVYLDKDVFWLRKIPIIILICYALSPIDLIPDFIPILGMLDDFIIIPLGILFCTKIIPKNAWERAKEKISAGVEIPRKYKIIGLIIILTIWLAIITAIVLKLTGIY